MIDTPEPLDGGTSITQLPNGDLFCYGRKPFSGISLIIDKDRNFRMLPPGKPCSWTSSVYYKGKICCFGGFKGSDALNLSETFILSENKWKKLKAMPRADYKCHCIVFNGNILISGYYGKKLLKYHIKSNKFINDINHDFAANTRKILINIDKLYLIESRGNIWESDILDERNWNQVGTLSIPGCPSQVYCSYNKDVIYIGWKTNGNYYYIFNPDRKETIDINKEK